MRDYIIRGTSTDESIRFFSCITTAMVEEARTTHNCSPVSIAALGRMLTAGSMMGTMLKSEKDTMTLQINGKGPAGSIVVISDYTGNTRGYITNPNVELMQREDGKLDVGRAVGVDGVLTVVKDLGMKEPYVGQIPIISGEIGDDISSYFAASEQIPTAVGLGVLVEVDGHVAASGGFIIQLMPEADKGMISKLEERLGIVRSVTNMISSGLDAEGMIKDILGDIEYKVHEEKQVLYRCNCNKERLEKALISIGKQEMEDLIKDHGKAELVCHFCNSKYNFEKEELVELLEKATK
jgi:molecular chaperone Hsp33